jgi:hypothetical protein
MTRAWPCNTDRDGIVTVCAVPMRDASRPDRTLYRAVDSGQLYGRSETNPQLLIRLEEDEAV